MAQTGCSDLIAHLSEEFWSKLASARPTGAIITVANHSCATEANCSWVFAECGAEFLHFALQAGLGWLRGCSAIRCEDGLMQFCRSRGLPVCISSFPSGCRKPWDTLLMCLKCTFQSSGTCPSCEQKYFGLHIRLRWTIGLYLLPVKIPGDNESN